MTEPNDDNLELDITRMIDGELSESQLAELNRRLVRDPGGHRLRDAVVRTDALAAAALREAVGVGKPVRIDFVIEDIARPRRHIAGALTIASVAAASLACGVCLAWWLGLAGRGQSTTPGAATGTDHATAPIAIGDGDTARQAVLGSAHELIWRALAAEADAQKPDRGDESVPLPNVPGPRDVQRQSDRQLYGVYDEENQTVYLLGVDRTKTRVRAIRKDL
jgi:anti-sigma factor RsiW